MLLTRITFSVLLFLLTSIKAQVLVPEVYVEEERGSNFATSNLNSYSTFKSERVNRDALNNPASQTLGDVLANQVGVDTQVYCANCGAKRLTINGLKGEHTSILIDGVPLHSAVSSFYGVDNIPITGLKDIEVFRGAGASLTNPEAIGGTINLITVDPMDFKSSITTSIGINDQGNGQSENHSFLIGKTMESKKFGFVIGGQFTGSDTWDEDNNNVSELPQREAKSALMKLRMLPSAKLDLSLRLGYSELEILGGFHDPQKPNTVRAIEAGEADFEGGDVERKYTGPPEKITDWIEVKRTEATFVGTYFVNSKITADFKGGYARQEQGAIYQHGFDYANIDNLFVADSSLQYASTNHSVFKVGAFVKSQRLRSASQALFERYASNDSRDIKKDSFDYLSTALYATSTFFFSDFEIDIALRADKVNIDWLELTNEVDEFVLAPRLMVLHNLNDHWTQRFSYGLGYRAPLTFFESQHGNNESGYEVDINKLEKAHSLVYSLSHNTPDYYVTLGSHYTFLMNMAFGEESFNNPIYYRNSPQNFSILVNDLLIGFKPMHELLLEFVYENFNYQNGYKRKLPTAAIENRFTLRSTYKNKNWTHSFSAQIIAGRDLSAYGRYDQHFTRRNQSLEPIRDSSLERKDQRAPWFTLFNTSLSYKVKNDLELLFGINNILDYTQAKSGDTPSTWHWHFNHAHFDGLHTWGPNAGREFNLGVKYTF